MSVGLVDMVELATRVKQVAIGHPRAFVGIDGPGGSGKSTFAERLVAAMGDAYLVRVDDFYLPSSRRHERFGKVGQSFDLPRLAEQVIVPGPPAKRFVISDTTGYRMGWRSGSRCPAVRQLFLRVCSA